MFKGKNLKNPATLLGLFLITTGISWSLFSYLRDEPQLGNREVARDEMGALNIENLPKTEECPLNGQMYTKPEKDAWMARRPITAVIENSLDARPLSGLSRADVVYEAVAEGGITRFLGVFYCGAAAQDMQIAVIRSARVYFINWATEYGDKPLFLHWGGANNIDRNSPSGVKVPGQIDPAVDTFKLLSKIGWRNGTYGNDLDGASNFGYPGLQRVQDRRNTGKQDSAEHTPVAFVNDLYEQAAERGFAYEDSSGKAWDENFVPWKFAEDNPSANPAATEISFEFWSNKPNYDVTWEYNADNNSYLRFNGGKEFTDYFFDNTQISAKNVAIQFVAEKGPVDREGHMFYTTTGTGDALIFQNGEVIDGTWKKLASDSRTKFYDSKGTEIKFVRGPIWIEAIPSVNKVDY